MRKRRELEKLHLTITVVQEGLASLLKKEKSLFEGVANFKKGVDDIFEFGLFPNKVGLFPNKV